MKKFYSKLFVVFTTIIACIGCAILLSANLKSSKINNNVSAAEESGSSTYASDATATETIYYYVGGEEGNGELILSSNDTAKFPNDEMTEWAASGSFDGSATWTGASAPYYSSRESITSIRFEGEVVPTSMSAWFYNLTNVTSINFTYLDTSLCTSWYRTFYNNSFAELDISGLDLSSITTFEQSFTNNTKLTNIIAKSEGDGNAPKGNSATTFYQMFRGCSSLQTIDVSAFSTTNVLNFSQMFYGCSGLETLYSPSLVGSKATDLSAMFYGCSKLTEIDFNGWNTSNVETFVQMFYNCSSLESLELPSFVSSKATNLSNMFYGCSSLTEINLKSWNTSKVTNFSGMFQNCSSLKELEMSHFSNVGTKDVNFSYMFNGLNSLEKLDISGFPVHASSTVTSMFAGLHYLRDIKISSTLATRLSNSSSPCGTFGNQAPSDNNLWFNVSNITTAIEDIDASRYTAINALTGFNSAGRYVNVIDTTVYWGIDENGVLTLSNSPRTEEINNSFRGSSISNWNAYRTSIKEVKIDGTVTLGTTSQLFYGLTNLETIDLTGLNTVCAKNMNQMFQNCSSLTILDVSMLSTKNLVNLSSIFSGCSSLIELDLKSWTTSNVTNFTSMFQNCSSLTELDLSHFSNVNTKDTNFTYMFNGLTRLEKLDISNFPVHASSTVTNMFGGLSYLRDIKISSTLANRIKASNSPCGTFGGYQTPSDTNLWFNVGNSTAVIEDINVTNLTPINALTGFTGAGRYVSIVDTVIYWGIDENGVLTLSNTPRTEEINSSFRGTESSNWNSYRTSIKEIKIDGNVTLGTAASLFYNLTNLETINLEGLNTICVKNMYRMFYNCSSLQELDVSLLSTLNAINFSQMFYDCSSLTSLDVSTFNSSKVTDFSSMFYGCSSATEINVKGWNTSSGVNFSGMFQNCRSVVELDLAHFSNVNTKDTNFTNMFNGLTGLEKLDISNFPVYASSTVSNMFGGFNFLRDIKISSALANRIKANNSPCGTFGNQTPSDNNLWFYVANNTATLENINVSTLSGINALTGFASAGRYINIIDPVIYWGIENGVLTLSNSPRTEEINNSFRGNDAGTSHWTSYRNIIKEVKIDGTVTPGTTASLFYTLTNLETVNLEGLNTVCVRTMYRMFSGCSSLKSVNPEVLSVSNVTNFTSMFQDCGLLTILDLSNWVTSSAITMDNMFNGCSKLEEVYLTKFNTSAVTNISSMFRGCAALTNIDISTFNTSLVTDFSYLFNGCSNLSDLKISSTFKGSKATNIANIFAYTALETLDLSNFDTTNALTNVTYSFYNMTKLKSLNISKINFSKTSSTLSNTFSNLFSLKEITIDSTLATVLKGSSTNYFVYPTATTPWFLIGSGQDNKPYSELTPLTSYKQFTTAGKYRTNIDYYTYWAITSGELVLSATPLTGDRSGSIVTSRVYSSSPWQSYASQITSFRVDGTLGVGSMAYWFYNFTNLKSIDFTGLDTSVVTSMHATFYGCTSLTTIPTDILNVYYVEDFSYTFQNCSALTSLDLSSWRVAKATTTANMFNGCTHLAEITFGNFGGESNKTMAYMFQNCSSLSEVDLSGFNPKAVETLSKMFNGCSSLTSVNLSSFGNTSALTDMSYMFYNCTNILSVDFKTVNTTAVKNIDYAFYNCSSLKVVDLSTFRAQKLTSMQYLFYRCVSLISLDLSSFDLTAFSNTNSVYYRSSFTSLDSLQQIRASANMINKIFSKSVGLESIISTTVPWYERDVASNPSKITNAKDMKTNTWYRNPYATEIYWFVEDNILTITSAEAIAEGKDSHVFMGSQAFNSNTTPWNSYKTTIKKVVISGIVTPASTAYWFTGFTALQEVDLSGLVTQSTTSVAYMFSGCTSLKVLDISTFDMTTITSYSYFLSNLKSCNEIYINEQQAGKMVSYGFVVQVPMYNETLKKDISKASEMTVAGAYLGGIKVTFTDGKGWNKVVSVSYGNKFDIRSVDFNSLPIPDTDNINHIMYIALDKWLYADETEVNFEEISGSVTVYASYKYIKFNMPEGDLIYNTNEHNITVENPFNYEYTLTYFYNSSAANGIFNSADSTVNAGYYYARLTVDTKYVDSAVYHVLPIQVTVTGITGPQNKVYDQSTSANLITSGVTVIGMLDVDLGEVEITAKGYFVDSNVGNDKTINITEILISSPNYIVNIEASQSETTGNIIAKDIDGLVQFTGIENKTYIGSEITQNFTVTVEGKRLTLGTDYTVSYENNTNAGDATILISGTGNYAGIASTTFTISKKNISTSDVSAVITPVTYTGSQITNIEIEITYKNIVLSTSDFNIISFANNVNAGMATVTIEGAGANFEGNKTISFKINQLSLEDCNIEFNGLEESYQYDGIVINPDFTLVVNDIELEKDSDFTSFCLNNTKPGTATIRVTGKGNYTGVITKEFTIAALDFKDCTISFEHDSLNYNGTSQKQVPIIIDKDGQAVDSAYYKLAYSSDTINAGTVTVTITGQVRYLFSEAVVTYTISPISLEDATISEVDEKVYNRKDQHPAITVVLGEKTLTIGSDYELEYTNNINVGTASITVTGKGNYFGTVTSSFEIIAAEITSLSLKVKQVYYNGNAQIPSILNVMAGNFVLNEDEYDIIYLDKDDNSYTGNFINVDTIKVRVVPKNGNNNLIGSAEVTYTIRAAIISNISLAATQVPFNWNNNNPVVTKVTASNGYVLDVQKGEYYLEFYRANEQGMYDETVSTTDFISAGKIKVVAKTTNPNFTSSASVIFEITKLSIQDSNVTIKYYFVDESGNEILEDGNRTYMVEDQFIPGKKVAPEISYNGTIVNEEYYSFNIITIDGNEDNSFTSVGRYKIVVSGMGSFTGSVERTYKIVPRPFTPENIEVVLNVNEFGFNGLPQTYNFDSDDIIVYDITNPENKIRLILGEHFELADGTVQVQYDENTTVTLKPKNGYITNVNAGTATLILKGKDGEYSNDVIVVVYKITERSITDCTISDIEDVTYNGRLQEPDINIIIDSYTLVKGTDFIVSYENNLIAGIGIVKITGINNFVGTTSTSFIIKPKDITDSDIIVSGLDKVSYNGKEQKPTISIVYKVNGYEDMILVEDEFNERDFVVVYSSNNFVNPSNITVYIFGTNNYTGTLTLTYTIDKLVITAIDFFDKDYSCQYTALHHDLLSRVVVIYEFDELLESGETQKLTDIAEKSGYILFYQLELDDGSFGEILPLTEDVRFINAGKIRISLQASEDGPYKTTSNLYVDFEITAFALADENVADVDSVEFTGEGLTPEPIVTYDGNVLKKDVDYTLSYENNINVGNEAILKVTGIGSYKGTITKNFTITPKDIGFADITIINNDLIYNGETQSLSGEDISLELDGITLVYGTDFEFEYENDASRIVAGTYKFSAVGKGNYVGTTVKYNFNILPRDIATINFGEFEPVKYTGGLLTPVFQLIDSFSNREMIIGSDVVLSYGDASTNVNVAWARRNGELVIDSQAIMIVSAGTNGNYTGIAIVYFAIAPINLATDTSIEIDPITGIHVLYGEPIKIIPTIKLNNGEQTITLSENTFNYLFTNVDRAGMATVSIVAYELSNFVGQKDLNYTILDPNSRPDLADADIINVFGDVEYDGTDKTPDFNQLKVYMGFTLLVYGVDYTIEYSTADGYFTNIGKKEINIVAVRDGNYKGSQKISFSILGRNDQLDIFLYYGSEDNKLTEWTYNQYDVDDIELSKTYPIGREPSIEYYRVNDDGTTTLINGIENAAGDYFIRASIKEVGEYRALVFDYHFTIKPIEITFSGIKAEDKVYDGSAEAMMNINDLEFVGVIGDDEVSLVARLVFDSANAGTGKTVYITNVELIGANAKNYKLAENGCQTETTANISKRTFVVILNIPSATMVYIKVEEVDYDIEGFNQSTAGILRLSFTNTEDNSVIYTMPQTVGTYRVEVVFENESAEKNYAFGDGSKVTGTITINPATVTVSNVLPVADQEYTGKEVTPNIVIIYEGIVLERNVDYFLAYSNNIDVGTATISVICRGNFTGSFSVNFEIYEPEVELSNVKMQDWIYGDDIKLPTYNAPEFVNIIITYSLSADGEFTSEIPTAVGTYFVKVEIKGHEDIFEICSFRILPKEITANIETNDYVYGQTVAAPSVEFDGVVGDDELEYTITYICEENGYNSVVIPTSVGTYTVVISIENENYTLSASATFTISVLEAEVVIEIEDWTYGDNSNSPTFTLISNGEIVDITGFTLGFVYSDSEDGEYSYEIPTKAGIYYVKAVIETSDNYTLSGTPVSFEIAQRVITITKVTAESKIFDGSVDAVVTITEANGILAGDDVIITASGRFSDINVSRNKIVTAYDFVLSGEDASNYVIAESGNRTIANAAITAAEITDVAIEGYKGTYDGEDHEAVIGDMSCFTVNEEEATWLFSIDDGDDKVYGEMPNFKNAGTFTVYFKISAQNHADYYGEFTVTISKAELTITANNKNVIKGKPMPELTYKIEGLIGVDTLADAVTNLLISCDYTTGAAIGEVFDIILSGEELLNYNVTFVSGKLTVVEDSDIITIVEDANIYFATPNEDNILTKLEDRTSYDGEGTIYLTGLKENMTWAELLDLLENNDDITAVDINGNVLTADSLVGTGTVITKGEDKITVVLLGDVDGDGEVTVFDKIDLQMILEEMADDFIEARLLAADIDHDGEVTVFDKIDMQRHLEELANIYEPEEEEQVDDDINQNIKVPQIENYNQAEATNEKVENISQIVATSKTQETVQTTNLSKDTIEISQASDAQDETREAVEVVYNFNEEKKYLHKKRTNLEEDEEDD